MAGSFSSFSINDGDWVRLRQFIQLISTRDLQGGGTLVPYSGAANDVNLGTHTLTTTGTLNSGTHTIGTLVLAGASITDTTGAISFGNENLSTTGSMTGASFISETLTITGASITDSTGIIGFGNENLYTSGTISLGYAGTTPYPLFIKAISGVSYTIYIKDSSNYVRSIMESIGAQSWQLNTGAAESGKIAYATPGGNSAVLLYKYDHTTGTTFYYRNTFGLTHQDTTFGMGYSDDGYATIAFHKGSKCQINWGKRDIDFQVSGDTDDDLIYCDASTDRIGISTATPATTFDVLGTSRLGDSATNYAQFAADGELTLTGTARIKNVLWLETGAIKAPGAKPATYIANGITGAWQFADAVAGNEETISGDMRVPRRMDRTVAPIISIGWSADGANPGNCEWQLEYLWRAVNEDTTAAAQETVTVTSTASATANGLIVAEFSGVDAPSATDMCISFRIKRLSASANDTITDTVELHGVCFEFITNKLGTAT